MTWYYKNMAPQQADNFKTFYQDMNFDTDAIDRAQKLNSANYAADLLGALRSGLLWSALSNEERELLASTCHPSQLAEFV